MPESYEQHNTYDATFEVYKIVINILKDKDKEYYELFEDYIVKTTILCASTGACIAFVLYFLFQNPIISVLVMAAGCLIAGAIYLGGTKVMQDEIEELQEGYDEILESVRAISEQAKEGEDR